MERHCSELTRPPADFFLIRHFCWPTQTMLLKGEIYHWPAATQKEEGERRRIRTMNDDARLSPQRQRSVKCANRQPCQKEEKERLRFAAIRRQRIRVPGSYSRSSNKERASGESHRWRLCVRVSGCVCVHARARANSIDAPRQVDRGESDHGRLPVRCLNYRANGKVNEFAAREKIPLHGTMQKHKEGQTNAVDKN